MSAILDKIRRLLALAQDAGATPGEAEAALGRAAHLQRAHGITDDAIRAHVHASAEGITIDVGAVTEHVLREGKRIGRWESWIARAVSTAAGCGHYLGGGGTKLVVFGLPTDVAVAGELFGWCMLAMDRARRAWCRANGVQFGSRDGKSYADGFCVGLIEAGKRAAQEAQADQAPVPTAQAGGTALVMVTAALVAKAKASAVDRYGRDKLRLVSGRSRRATYGAGYGAGQAAGAATSLSRRAIG